MTSLAVVVGLAVASVALVVALISQMRRASRAERRARSAGNFELAPAVTFEAHRTDVVANNPIRTARRPPTSTEGAPDRRARVHSLVAPPPPPSSPPPAGRPSCVRRCRRRSHPGASIPCSVARLRRRCNMASSSAAFRSMPAATRAWQATPPRCAAGGVESSIVVVIQSSPRLDHTITLAAVKQPRVTASALMPSGAFVLHRRGSYARKPELHRRPQPQRSNLARRTTARHAAAGPPSPRPPRPRHRLICRNENDANGSDGNSQAPRETRRCCGDSRAWCAQQAHEDCHCRWPRHGSTAIPLHSLDDDASAELCLLGPRNECHT